MTIACAWWPIIPCMKCTSAAVKGGTPASALDCCAGVSIAEPDAVTACCACTVLLTTSASRAAEAVRQEDRCMRVSFWGKRLRGAKPVAPRCYKDSQLRKDVEDG